MLRTYRKIKDAVEKISLIVVMFCIGIGISYAATVIPDCNPIGTTVAGRGQCWWNSTVISIPSGIEYDWGLDKCCRDVCPSGWCSDKSGCAKSVKTTDYISSSTVTNGFCLRTKTCVCGTCSYDISGCTVPTHCAAGYYKNGNTCTICPEEDSVRGVTVDKNTAGITSCYIKSGTGFSNDTGVGTYSGNSYYCN